MANDPKFPRKVRMDGKKLPAAAIKALDALHGLTCGYSGMSIVKIEASLAVLKQHCGALAEIKVWDDDYYGGGTEIEWFRMETSAEVEKRLAKNAKRRATLAVNKPVVDKAKRDADLAELARLQKLYPGCAP